MNEFRDVTVVRKANVYFDGKVTSRTVKFKIRVIDPVDYCCSFLG